MHPPRLPDDQQIPDLLVLAKMYESGLGKLWKDKSEAARVLAITYPRIRRKHLTAAASLADYPAEVLELFKDVGIGTWACRSLGIARKKDGTSVLIQRAQRIKKADTGFTRARLMQMLTSSDGAPVQEPSKSKNFNPKDIVKAYQCGLAEGRWSTYNAAESELGIDKSVIAVACAFLALPTTVLKLFNDKVCTYDVCREILEIQKVYGRTVLIHRAKTISEDAQNLKTADEIIRLLLGMVHHSAAVTPRIKFSRNQRKIVVEFHCEDSRFLLDRSNALFKLIAKGFTPYVDAAIEIVSVGATPAVSKK